MTSSSTSFLSPRLLATTSHLWPDLCVGVALRPGNRLSCINHPKPWQFSSTDWQRWLFIIHHEELITFVYTNTTKTACKHPNNMQQKKSGWTYNSFKVSLPCFHHMENIKPDGEENTSHWHRCSDGSLSLMFWLPNPDKRIDCERLLHLGGTAKTSGWRWAKPNGSLSSFSRVSTQVWMWLRWAGMAAAHFLSTGRGQSAGGGGRSTEGKQGVTPVFALLTFTGVQIKCAWEVSIHLIWQDPQDLLAVAD